MCCDLICAKHFFVRGVFLIKTGGFSAESALSLSEGGRERRDCVAASGTDRDRLDRKHFRPP